MLEHRDGVPWWEAAPPPRRHRHRWQTRGYARGRHLERCACGAASEDGAAWFFIGHDRPRVRRGTLARLGLRLIGLDMGGHTPGWPASPRSPVTAPAGYARVDAVAHLLRLKAVIYTAPG